MPGSTIADEIEGVESVETAENTEGVHMADDMDTGGSSRFDISFLKARTGDGPVEDYINHPLNFNDSRAVARILRGATGLVGQLDFAVADIAFGMLEYMRGRRSVESD